MRAQSKWLWAALAISAVAFAGRAQAATPYSRVKPMTEYTTVSTFPVSFEATGSEGTVTQVDLWASKDGGVFSIAGTVYDAVTPFNFSTVGQGDGRYAFYTIATLSTGDVESKSGVVEAYTNVDTSAPATLDVSKLSINQQPSLLSGEVVGATTSVEPNSTVEMYADSAMTVLLRSIRATDSGSFGPMTVGGSEVSSVWLAARDAAGNRGAAIKLDNNMSYTGTLTDFKLIDNGGHSMLVTFVAPISAKQFRVQYRHAGGAVWSVDYYTVGVNGTTIGIIDLEPGRAYDVRVAPVDERLNVGLWSMASIRTSGTPINDVVLPGESAPQPVVTTAVAQSTPSTTTVSTPSTTPVTTSVSDDDAALEGTTKPADGQPAVNEPVEGEPTTEEPATTDPNAETNTEDETEAQNGSATPWVILAILIVLAGIATGGYFYWFSGPEEVTTAVTPTEEVKPEDAKPADETPADADDADKRW